MLQFWKKSGQKEKLEKSKKNKSPSKLPSPQLSNGDVLPSVNHNIAVDYLSDFNIEDSTNTEGHVSALRSQLSKSLAEVLYDKGALGYFIQYLEAHDQLPLIKFWLDVESFRAAASTRNCDDTSAMPVAREQLDVFDDPTRLSPQPSQRSISTDCDSLFDSPSHSIDSGDNIYSENSCSRTVSSYVNDNQDIRNSVPIKETAVHKIFKSNNPALVNTHTDSQVQNIVISHPLQDLTQELETGNRSDSFLQPVKCSIVKNRETHCDQTALATSCYNRNETCTDAILIRPTVNCERTDVDNCVCGGASFTDIVDISNKDVLKNEKMIGIFCDRCSVMTTESETKVVDGIAKDSLTLQCDIKSSALKLGVSTPMNRISEKRTARSHVRSSISQAVVDDALRIYAKYLSLRSVYKIPVSNAIKERVVLAICKEDGIIDTETFTEAQTAVFHIMERDHFNNFLHSEYHCKHQIDVLTSGKVTMADILYNETALFYFMEFMEQESNRHLVEFWLAAVNFQQHLLSSEGGYDPLEAQNDAMVLYDKYFSLQATSSLGFGDQIRFAVEQDICRDEGPLPDCFAKPVSIVQHALQKNFLQPFLTSQLHFKYLSELVNTIQANPSLLSRRGKSGSECSSDWNISVQNTLLASEDSSGIAKRALRRMGAKELSIDSCQLNDPDSLWKRRHHRGLSFGRINSMGRFETDVEPEPDRKEESRITKVVKKLVNMEEDKAKEEMAWQIAEMIVNDITSLTLGNGDDEPVQS